MTAPRILIAYASTYGQTAKVARYVADVLAELGAVVTLVDANVLPRSRDLPHGQSLRDFDAVVVGSSILYRRHHRSVRTFAREYHDALNAMPSAFFSVSGSAAGSSAAQADARRIDERFHRETGWHPALEEQVGGAMAYTKYSPLVRWVLKRISAGHGGPTDTSRDHELTSWTQVRRFAEAVAAAVPAAAPSAVPDERRTATMA